jgi:hypothetical protein
LLKCETGFFREQSLNIFFRTIVQLILEIKCHFFFVIRGKNYVPIKILSTRFHHSLTNTILLLDKLQDETYHFLKVLSRLGLWCRRRVADYAVDMLASEFGQRILMTYQEKKCDRCMGSRNEIVRRLIAE